MMIAMIYMHSHHVSTEIVRDLLVVIYFRQNIKSLAVKLGSNKNLTEWLFFFLFSVYYETIAHTNSYYMKL